MVQFLAKHKGELPPVTARDVRKVFRQKWKYNLKVKEFGRRDFVITIDGRNVAIEEEDLKDLFVRDLMVEKVHVEEWR